jgi:hypothetical protein
MKYLFLLTIFNIQYLHSQTLNENVLCNLPSVINESSGLERDSAGNFWSHNDSGGEPKLYYFNENGTLLSTVKISNAENMDWEDIALSSNGRIFIGDFGNNGNDREDLKILIININNLIPGFNLRSASIINFSYAEQTAFPPDDTQKNFDAEAMVYRNDSIYIFTKNRTLPFDGKCYQYCFPAVAGTYEISRSDTLYIPGGEVESRVVGADFDSVTNKLALLTSTKVLIFNSTTSNDLISSNSGSLSFGNITQKEGICWGDSCKLYVTDEYIAAFNLGGKLYKAELCNALGSEASEHSEFTIYPNPTEDLVFIKFTKTPSKKRNISGELLTSKGEIVNILHWNPSENNGEVSTKNVSKGQYMLHIKENGATLTLSKIQVH